MSLDKPLAARLGPKAANGSSASNDDGVVVFVNNLDFGVTTADMQKLFAQWKPTSAEVQMSKNGKSRGSAKIILANVHDAEAAKKKYDGVELDGRPMRLIVKGGNAGGAPSSSSSSSANGKGKGGRLVIQVNNGGDRVVLEGQGRGGRGGNRSRGRGGRGRGRGGRGGPRKTPEEMDAELGSYMQSD